MCLSILSFSFQHDLTILLTELLLALSVPFPYLFQVCFPPLLCSFNVFLSMALVVCLLDFPLVLRAGRAYLLHKGV